MKSSVTIVVLGLPIDIFVELSIAAILPADRTANDLLELRGKLLESCNMKQCVPTLVLYLAQFESY